MVGDVGIFDVEAAGFDIGEETLNSLSLSIAAQFVPGFSAHMPSLNIMCSIPSLLYVDTIY